MSRWTDNFKNHPFQHSWSTLLQGVEAASVDDKTIVTSVEELARLKKVLAYLNGLLSALDPELVPLSVWDAFNEQCTQSVSQINAYAQDRNISRVQQTNAYADNLLSYLRPYVAAGGRTAKSLREAALAYSEVMKEQLIAFRDVAEDSLARISDAGEKIVLVRTEVNAARDEIILSRDEVIGSDEEVGAHGQIVSALAKAEESANEIDELNHRLLIGTDDEPSVKRLAVEAAESARLAQKKASDILVRVEESVGRLSSFHDEVFGLPDESGEYSGGLSAEVKAQKARMILLETEHKKKYAALNDEIQGLLPGATSAGLASAYQAMKKSFDGPIRFSGSVFYAAIAFLVVASALSIFTWDGGVRLIDAGDWLQVLRGFAQRLPFYLPVVWLAYFASKRRSEYQRLQQEYAHKEAVASSYESFKRQVDALGAENNELLKSLLARAIDAMSHNASATLDGKHGDKMPAHEGVDKVLDRLISSDVGVELFKAILSRPAK
jgi:hypothetical protein